MEALFESLIETGWGAIIIGAFILIAIIVEILSKNNTPRT